MRRLLGALAVVGLASGGIWLATRPAVLIDIARGGQASLVTRWGGRRPLPDTIVVARGGRPRVRIRNADGRAHAVGLFRAEPGTATDYALPGPGTFTGRCSVHPRAELTIVVR